MPANAPRPPTLLTLCPALVLTCSGCCWFVGSDTTVLVAEQDTGRPVPGAAVRQYYDNCYFGGAPTGPGRPFYTDAHGRARIKVLGALYVYGFAVEAEGYEQVFPPDFLGNPIPYHPGQPAPDGTRVLHVRPSRCPKCGTAAAAAAKEASPAAPPA